MARKVELVTIKEACTILGISRDTFYRVLKDYVVQIPSTSKEGKYDKQSVINRYAEYKGVSPDEFNKKQLA